MFPGAARQSHHTQPNKMKATRLFAAGLCLAAMSLSSCISPYAGPNERVGSVIGAGTGALAGAVIGNQSGRPLEGGAIGAVVGALAGSAIGGASDDVYFNRSYYRPRYYSSYPVTRYHSYSYDYCPPVTYHHYHGGGCYVPHYRSHCW
jgi:uncharacterized membrane protein YebE (DUF533 family)